MNNRNMKIKKQSRIISGRILFRLIVSLVIYTFAGIFLFWASVAIYNLFTWQGNELLYTIAHWFDMRIDILVALYFIIGYSLIFYFYWKKPFRYLDILVEANKNLYNLNDNFIVLPDELKEIELQLNQIKMAVRNSERAAKEAEQRKNDLVVYLAHDLKTPLTSVIGYLTLLRDENKLSDELREKYTSISLEKAERLEDLINEFFEITRFNLSNLTLELSKVNLTRMLEQLAFEFKPMLIMKNLNCVLNTNSNIIIKCDANKMQRVFDNLLRNAVNYSFENSTVTITVTQDNYGINLTFMNYGNTIPAEKLERIFDQFYRLDTSRATKTGGAGLGLAIAKQIVELHHGTITALSENETICFKVTIPAL